MAGIEPARIAELIGCTEKQVAATIEEYASLRRARDDWDAVIERERPKSPTG